MLRPSSFGSCSIFPMSFSSCATRSSTSLPSSMCAICRPRYIIVTLTLLPSDRNSRAWRVLKSKSWSSMPGRYFPSFRCIQCCVFFSGGAALVPLRQEFARMARLEVEVVVVDARPVLHFFQMNHVLLFLRGARRLGLLELELAVVHDLDHGRPGERRDFHEIQAPLMRGGQGFIDRQHAQRVAVVRDPAHGTDANLPVDARAWCFAVVL